MKLIMKANNTVVIATNFNKKLGCDIMMHLDIAPFQPILESAMEKAVIEFKTADGSYPPTFWRLIDVARLGSDKLQSALTLPSHGLDACDFWQWLVQEYAGKKDYTNLAIFTYKKLTD